MLNAIQQGILRLICSIAKIYETEVIRELIFRKITVNTFCPGDATKKEIILNATWIFYVNIIDICLLIKCIDLFDLKFDLKKMFGYSKGYVSLLRSFTCGMLCFRKSLWVFGKFYWILKIINKVKWQFKCIYWPD